MAIPLTTRKATSADIPFLTQIEYEASLPPLDHCFWEDLLEGTDTTALEFIEAELRTDASNWGNVHDFIVLEEQGKPVAAAAGYVPNPEDYCPLRLSQLEAIAQALKWSSATTSLFRDRYLGLFGGDLTPFFLTPQASWIIENVAVLPAARGRGLGKALLQAVLEEGRAQGHSYAGIMVINGNDRARHAYEAVGFKPYQTFYADYFSEQFNIEFPGVTKFGLSLRAME
ncbi:MAG: GNAT family N-acetyltransferase [Synechococcales cyanobacterium K44_A2020_017]|nr:GNAT family N-acetyltransferase [Synechococcales cyanobacterium K32_A2020_035]MBF2095912.1 GNAT family N-acetyltransferase [Synechococcales cyanobacterium K44_A2020_017]